MNHNQLTNFPHILTRRPDLSARIKGSHAYPRIDGTVSFYETTLGVLVSAQISGLPTDSDKCRSPVFAFHIHSGSECTGDAADPFKNAMTHLNPSNCPHPYHAGDLPPLFGAKGFACSAFLTDRFTLKDIIGKVIVIHANPDDFTTQPAGNSGAKIACGVIKKV
ncbi:MAG: superoxide dismutase family protein [Ruminococcus sp.]|nr:superoxide dismutase family protein [Ruminococcus sp.]